MSLTEKIFAYEAMEQDKKDRVELMAILSGGRLKRK